MTTKVEWYWPLLADTDTAAPGDIEAGLASWKEHHLNGIMLRFYERLKNPRKRNRLVRWAIITWRLFKYYWPLVVLAILAAVLPTSSIVFLSCLLVPVQALYFVLWVIRFTMGAAASAAIDLEQEIENDG